VHERANRGERSSTARMHEYHGRQQHSHAGFLFIYLSLIPSFPFWSIFASIFTVLVRLFCLEGSEGRKAAMKCLVKVKSLYARADALPYLHCSASVHSISFCKFPFAASHTLFCQNEERRPGVLGVLWHHGAWSS